MLRWEVINKLKEDIQNMKSRMNLKGNLIRTSGNQSDRRLHKTEGRHLLWAHIICHFSLSVPKRQSPLARDHHLGQISLGQRPSLGTVSFGQRPSLKTLSLGQRPSGEILSLGQRPSGEILSLDLRPSLGTVSLGQRPSCWKVKDGNLP